MQSAQRTKVRSDMLRTESKRLPCPLAVRLRHQTHRIFSSFNSGRGPDLPNPSVLRRDPLQRHRAFTVGPDVNLLSGG